MRDYIKQQQGQDALNVHSLQQPDSAINYRTHQALQIAVYQQPTK